AFAAEFMRELAEEANRDQSPAPRDPLDAVLGSSVTVQGGIFIEQVDVDSTGAVRTRRPDGTGPSPS
ncbi:MAG: hypothetical protein U0792_00005, partial [Gemmataceae bacterium]